MNTGKSWGYLCKATEVITTAMNTGKNWGYLCKGITQGPSYPNLVFFGHVAK
jgi:hypothetical protein